MESAILNTRGLVRTTARLEDGVGGPRIICRVLVSFMATRDVSSRGVVCVRE
jgi:hypothetical protein